MACGSEVSVRGGCLKGYH